MLNRTEMVFQAFVYFYLSCQYVMGFQSPWHTGEKVSVKILS